MALSHPQITFAAINVKENPRIGRQLQIRGFPMVMYFADGEKSVFSGRLDKSSFLLSCLPIEPLCYLF